MASLHTHGCLHRQSQPLAARRPPQRAATRIRPVPEPRLERPEPATARTGLHRGLQLRCRAEASSPGVEPLLIGGKIDPEDLMWERTTVLSNKEASADGSLRTLVLSVEDHVTFMDGRKVKHVQESPRWVDAYKVPGQHVAVRYCAGGSSIEDCLRSEVVVARQLQAIASSPYEARRDSAMLDASIIELLVSRNGDEDERALAELGPGALIEVSNVVGQGFASLFNSQVGLASLLECSQALVMVGIGSRGIAPLHAALTWTPVQAHATAHRVSLFYVAESQASAAYLVEWDAWREAGVHVEPIYLSPSGAGAWGATPELALEQAIFHGEQGLRGVTGSNPREAVVLMSGVPGDVAAHLTRKFTQAGVERVLFCDIL